MKTNYCHRTFVLIFILCSYLSFSQDAVTASQILEHYEEYKERSLNERRIKYQDIQPLIKKWKEYAGFKVQKVGTSIEGRELSLISVGSGETDIFLWSQMHGDESTATMAIFDILNFLADDSFQEVKNSLLNEVRLHFLPMLNPDGAQEFQRRNALGIDVNRDALRLQSPEARTLKRVRDSLEADFGFNLHDQSRYYNAEGTSKPATISFLAPAYDFEKSINSVREAAMKVIVEMNRELQAHIPGQVARYNDDFEPRAFGDNIQKWGTSTILIESGGYQGDPEKQEIRKLNFLAILSALFSISEESYKNVAVDVYKTIPRNDSKLFDLKLIGLEYDLLGETYILDLGINHGEISTGEGTDFYYRGRIADQGDLSTGYGYKEADVSGYKVTPGRIYPEKLQDLQALEQLDFSSLLSEGYSYVRVADIPKGENFTKYPVQIVGEEFKGPTKLQPGINPTFFLEKNGHFDYAVINGFLIDLRDSPIDIENGLILR